MKPTAPLRNKSSVFATTPSTSARFPASLVPIETRSLPTLTRSYPRRFTFYVAWPRAPFAALTHCRRIVFQRLPWLISLTHDLPSSFALAGYPVHLADSQSARFSLGVSEETALSGFTHGYYSFAFERAASAPLPARTSGRQRNFSSSRLSFASTASAMISPSIGANLNPCPLSPAATTNPWRSGSRAIQKCPSCVSQYMHTRV